MIKKRIRRNRPAQRMTEKSSKTSLTSWISAGIGLLALMSATLSIFGYGVILGITASFGYEIGAFVSSPMDFLINCVQGIIALTEKLSPIWEVIINITINHAKTTGIAIIIALLALSIIIKAKPVFQRYKTLTKKMEPNKILKFSLHLLALISCIILTPAFLVAIIFLIIILLSVLPAIGYESGKEYTEKYIISPNHCVPLRTEKSSKEASSNSSTGAICVEVKSIDGKFSRSGRLAFSTSNAILLFDKRTGSAERIPLANMTLKRISELPDLNQKEAAEAASSSTH